MRTEHTPGPWRADIRGGCAGVKSSEPDDSPGMGHDYPSNLLLFTKRGCITDGMYWSLPDETIANVRLAAAAPDLLEALQHLLPGAIAMGWDTGKAEAAIAKATGGAV